MTVGRAACPRRVCTIDVYISPNPSTTPSYMTVGAIINRPLPSGLHRTKVQDGNAPPLPPVAAQCFALPERTDSHARKRNDRRSGVAAAPTENLCHCEPQRGVAISCCQLLVLCWVRRWLSMTVPTSATCKQLHILGSVATILQRILFPVSCYVSPVSCQFYGLIEKLCCYLIIRGSGICTV